MIGLSNALTALSLLCGFTAAAWLRFDQNALLPSWIVVAVSLAAFLAGPLIRARHLPPTALPPDVEQLANKRDLSPEEDARLKDALRAWHDANQRTAYEEISRQGPWMLMAGRAKIYYFWLALLALMLVPPALLGDVFSPLPRFLVVLLPIAAVALLAAAPLGLRDWRRARRQVRQAG